MVWDFIKGLGRQRVNAVQAGLKGKAMGAQAKARAKAAGKMNAAVDGTVKGAKNKATGKGGKKQQQKAGGQKEEKEKKIFGRKKKGAEAGPPQQFEPEPDAGFGDKTQFIQAFDDDDRPKECVGWVVCLNGPLKGQDFRLVPGKNVLGTAADCDIVLTDQYLSARHSVIRYEEGQFAVVDLDSTNGTYVNDERVNKEELIDNDKIRVGRTELKFKALY